MAQELNSLYTFFNPYKALTYSGSSAHVESPQPQLETKPTNVGMFRGWLLAVAIQLVNETKQHHFQGDEIAHPTSFQRVANEVDMSSLASCIIPCSESGSLLH